MDRESVNRIDCPQEILPPGCVLCFCAPSRTNGRPYRKKHGCTQRLRSKVLLPPTSAFFLCAFFGVRRRRYINAVLKYRSARSGSTPATLPSIRSKGGLPINSRILSVSIKPPAQAADLSSVKKIGASLRRSGVIGKCRSSPRDCATDAGGPQGFVPRAPITQLARITCGR